MHPYYFCLNIQLNINLKQSNYSLIIQIKVIKNMQRNINLNACNLKRFFEKVIFKVLFKSSYV